MEDLVKFEVTRTDNEDGALQRTLHIGHYSSPFCDEWDIVMIAEWMRDFANGILMIESK